jgi:hypothetical protein
MWLKVDKAMNDYGIKINFEDVNGMNADDLVDWIYYNWEECEKIKKEYETHLKKGEKKIDIDKFNNNNNNNNNKYRTPQITLFSDIAVNKKPLIISNFIKQVIDKGIIKDEKDMDVYKNSVDSWIRTTICLVGTTTLWLRSLIRISL